METRMLRVALSSIALVCLSATLFAQRGNTAWTKYRHEAAIGYGMNNLFSSLGERDKPVFNTAFQRSTFNATYRYYVFKNFAARASFTHAYARKNDKSISGEPRENVRLDYQSTLTEFSGLIEYHIMDETTKGKRGKVRRARGGMSKGLNLGVSFFAGAGISHIRPFGEYQGNEVIFRPITEPIPTSNNLSYKRTNIVFPVGGQVRILVNENWRVGFEAGYRIGLREYINYVSGVYYRDPEATNPDPGVVDPQYIGTITFAKEQAPISQLVTENGKRNYFFGLVTLAYRIKS